jgi:hypothetical protein
MKSYFSLSIFSKLGFTKTILFILADVEYQALENGVHHKTEFLFETNDRHVGKVISRFDCFEKIFAYRFVSNRELNVL